jgi:hypothetical protein
VIVVGETASRMSGGSRRFWSATVAALAVGAALAAAPPGDAAGAVHVRAAAPAPGKPAKGHPAPAKPPGRPARGDQAAQGVVQSVSSSAVVLKRLDGSGVSVPVNAKTRVFVDGTKALLADVDPGFVVTASWKAGKPAAELQALSPRGAAGLTVVQAVRADAVVVRAADGTTVTIRVSARTRVFVDGEPARLHDVRAGFKLVTRPDRSKAGKPVGELRFLRPG